MANQIKLLSIKRTEEASYFYREDKVDKTLDSNENEVVEFQENHKAAKMSKKERKDEERKSKKEHKQSVKELKKLEKEKKKSSKKSKKEVIPSLDTAAPSGGTEIKTNGDVKSSHLINSGFQIGMDVDEAAMNEKVESLNDHEERNENEESKAENDTTGRDGVFNLHDDVRQEHENESSEHESAMKTHEETIDVIQGNTSFNEAHGISGEEHAIPSAGHENLELGNERHEEITTEVQENITAEGVQHTEEAPPDILYLQPKVNPEIPEPTGGQVVEIEISDVTDIETDVPSSDGIVVQHSVQASVSHSVAPSEGEITAATVQQVESGVDVEKVFSECNEPGEETDQEEKRKSVRFQEETEEIARLEHETNDHEHASSNLGADLSGTGDDERVEPSQALQPTIETVSKEQRSQAQITEVDLVDVFESSERESKNTEVILNEAEYSDEEEVDGVKVNDNRKMGNDRVRLKDLEEIDLNESNEQSNTAAKKKDKRKRGRLVKCCFP